MSWKDDPATEKQVNFLRQFGYESDHPLTKGEASDLIERFNDDPERIRILNVNRNAECDLLRQASCKEREPHVAYHLRLYCEQCKLELEKERASGEAESDPINIKDAKFDVRLAEQSRLGFWRCTLLTEPWKSDYFTESEDSPEQMLDLNSKYGFRFKLPTNKQIKSILAALDSDSPTWDRDMPEYFFQTLEHNFPDLLR